MKKILYLSDVSIDKVGGAQESMKEIIRGLEEHLDFYIITPKSNIEVKNQIVLNKYKDFVLKNKLPNEILALCLDIKKEINKIRPNIIHVQMPSTMIIIGVLKYFKLINKNVKILYTDRGVLDKYGNLTKICIKKFSHKFDKLIATTKYNASLHTKINNLPINKVEVIPNTAGVLFNEYEDSYRKNLRKNYSIGKTDIVIGFSGRVSEDKNWPLAIEILRKLKQEYSFKVLIALGTDKSQKNISEAESIINQISNIMGADNLISFIDIPLEKMQKVYYINDIFILTSKKESFGRTAVEAMARKNVVFGTKVDGLEEVIHFDENKYINVNELNAKLKDILADRKKLQEEKLKFYKYYHKKYAVQQTLNKYKNLYENI